MKIPRVLLTNDDGFDAPGLAALRDVARQIANEVWIVAPHLDQSGMGQSITLNNPLRCVARGDRQFALSGTPADCVIMGLSHFMKSTPPDVIFSGVNAGANTGDDVNLSGTLGAAFAALMLGVPAVGMSLDYASRQHLRWDTARALLPELLTGFARTGWSREHILSVNLPDLPAAQINGVACTRPARQTLSRFHIERREDLRERDYFWLYPQSTERDSDPQCDLGALAAGQISVTALKLDRSVALND